MQGKPLRDRKTDGWSVKSKRARGLAVQDEIGSGVHDFHVPLGKDHSSLSPDLLGAVCHVTDAWCLWNM